MAPLAVLVIMLQSVIAVPVCAYELGEFPGKGNYQVWRSAGQIYNSAIDLGEARKYDQSISNFLKAISMYPFDARYHLSLAASYDGRGKPGDLKKAEVSLKRGLSLYPKDWRSWAYLAELIYAINPDRAEESISSSKKALALNPPVEAIPQIKKDLVKFEQALNAKEIGHR